MKVWNIKAIYPHGDHYVNDENGNKLRFENKQIAVDKAEMLTASYKKSNSVVSTSYIVVEEM